MAAECQRYTKATTYTLTIGQHSQYSFKLCMNKGVEQLYPIHLLYYRALMTNIIVHGAIKS